MKLTTHCSSRIEARRDQSKSGLEICIKKSSVHSCRIQSRLTTANSVLANRKMTNHEDIVSPQDHHLPFPLEVQRFPGLGKVALDTNKHADELKCRKNHDRVNQWQGLHVSQVSLNWTLWSLEQYFSTFLAL